ncbi:MAG: DUF2270 domain-containing protein [Chloroflexi bacterium]|nr:DUF2270 domain-containing protein [Chloroflexota bacterium]MBV9897190.1 DUF2270 domain-containing protein [Chloroflexota bacterium]
MGRPDELSISALNALVHLYRAEVGRMTAYRQRLDTTTNWAITSSALVTTFSLGNATIPHEAFLFLMFVNGFFLLTEARRFRVYEAARYRVLLLERYFYPEVLGDGSQRAWQPALIEALRTPYSYPPVQMLAAIGWRLRRNYLWIYAAVLLTWVGKLEIGGGSADLIAAASIGRVPGAIVWAAVVLTYAALFGIGVLAKRTYPMGSEAAQAVLRQEPD